MSQQEAFKELSSIFAGLAYWRDYPQHKNPIILYWQPDSTLKTAPGRHFSIIDIEYEYETLEDYESDKPIGPMVKCSKCRRPIREGHTAFYSLESNGVYGEECVQTIDVEVEKWEKEYYGRRYEV